MQPYGYILTGGKSRRFGGDDKALALLGGQTLIERTVKLVESHCENITLVANRPDKYADLKYPVIVDRFPNIGPLGGIDSALNHVGDACWTFICPCDLGYVGKGWLESLIKHATPTSDAVVFQGERFEPLFTLYHSRILPLVEENIREKRLAPHHLFPIIKSVILPLPSDWPAEPSFNTRESLDAFKD
jgi:molybdopterin-guanine dinucleotide biosynthesis protein A